MAETLTAHSDMEEEVGRRPARACAKTTPAKTRAQNGNHKIDRTNELAESPDKDLVGGAMDGLTLQGDAPKTAGRAAKATKHDGKGDSVYEESGEREEPKEAHCTMSDVDSLVLSCLLEGEVDIYLGTCMDYDQPVNCLTAYLWRCFFGLGNNDIGDLLRQIW